jgi:hypothetical protein
MGLKRGDELRITIVEPYAGPSPPRACAAEFADALMLGPGTEIHARVRGFGGGYHISCSPVLLDIDPVGEWTWTFREPDEGASADIAGWYDITNGQCAGLAGFKIYDEAKHTFNVRLDRGNESCPPVCSVTFVVDVNRR